MNFNILDKIVTFLNGSHAMTLWCPFDLQDNSIDRIYFLNFIRDIYTNINIFEPLY